MIKLEINNFLFFKNQKVQFKDKNSLLIGESGSGKTLVLLVIKLLLEPKYHNYKTNFDFDISLKVSKDKYTLIQKNNRKQYFVNEQKFSKQQYYESIQTKLLYFEQNSQAEIFEKNQILNYFTKQIISCNEFKQYKVKYTEYEKITNEIATISKKPEISEIEYEYYKTQLKQLNKIELDETKYIEYLELRKTYKLQKKIDINKIIQLEQTFNAYEEKINSEIKQFSENNKNQIIKNLREISNLIDDEIDQVKNNTQTIDIDKVEEYLFEINQLERKFGLGIKNIQNKINEINENVYNFENNKILIVDLTKTKNKLESELEILAQSLNQKIATIINQKLDLIQNKLNELNINFKLVIKTQSTKYYQFGNNNYILTTEKAQDIKKLSGGEISRLNLAILTSIDYENGIILLDEIDTGVSGKIAFKIGKLIKKLSYDNTIIIISHSPQVISFKSDTYRVKDNKIEQLDSKEKLDELAKILSNGEYNEKAFKNAKELVELAKE